MIGCLTEITTCVVVKPLIFNIWKNNQAPSEKLQTGRLMMRALNFNAAPSGTSWFFQQHSFCLSDGQIGIISHIGAHIHFLQNCHQFWWIRRIFTNFGDFFIEIFVESLKCSPFLVNEFSQILVTFAMSKMSPISVIFL